MAHVKWNAVSHEINSDVIFESRMTLQRCIFWVVLIEYAFQINYEHHEKFLSHQWPFPGLDGC